MKKFINAGSHDRQLHTLLETRETIQSDKKPTVNDAKYNRVKVA